MTVSVRVYGLRETILQLKKYDKEMYKQIQTRLTSTAQPLADEVGQQFPLKPLKNWHTTNERKGKSRMPPYVGQTAKRKVKAVLTVSGSQRSRALEQRNEVGILRIQQMDGGGQVYDTAGSKKSSRFVKNLDKHLPRQTIQGRFRSRILFKAVESNLGKIEQEVAKAVATTDDMITARIAQEGFKWQ